MNGKWKFDKMLRYANPVLYIFMTEFTQWSYRYCEQIWINVMRWNVRDFYGIILEPKLNRIKFYDL